ncbi:putative ribonuclease H-like domain, hAT-like transposase, RNase-H [Rosa chinensis]|uniref:Putative ribonuclease H-like domain, hAT-like transposase, RNase-H n=1 Tax=Rosa chinensis TaxID=74649 RepID=A0A2P6R2I1_ROSCH|nr:putative ribonuclease H-like domain, hAT-like transposase, RNase-H [Rosa chinensis]
MCTIIGELDKCIQGSDPLLVNIGTSMKKKFDKYWKKLEDMNKIYLIAVVMDPRYKLLYLSYFFPKLQQDKAMVQLMVDEVKATFIKLYEEYAEADPEAARASIEASMPKMDSANELSVEEDSHAQNISGFMKLRKKQDVVEIKIEVDRYLLEAAEDPANLNFN